MSSDKKNIVTRNKVDLIKKQTLTDSQIFPKDVKNHNNNNMEMSVSSSYPTISNKFKQKKLMHNIIDAKQSRSSFMSNGSVIEHVKFD